jgi:hypothetical protein
LARLDLLHLSLHRLKLLLLLHKLLHIPLKLNQFFLELTTLSECFLVSRCATRRQRSIITTIT